MKNNNKIFSNERVSASAGSGKTHSLTSRFIALSYHEKNKEDLPDPTEIIALTFTRKSAGEFLTKILKRLADAVEDGAKLKELSESVYELSQENIDKEKAQKLLSQSVKNIDKLKLSTIDSFFSSTLKVFANEVGIFTPMQIIDSQTESDYQKSIIEFILENIDFSEAKFRNFIEIIKKTNGFSGEFLSLNEDLEKAICDALNFNRNLAKDIAFGDTSVIKSSPFLEWNQKEYDIEVQELEALINENKLAKTFNTLAKNLSLSNDKEVAALGTLSAEISKKYINNELIDSVEIPYGKQGKTHILPPEVSLKLNSILTRLHDAHIAKYFSASKLMGKILKSYKALYFRELTSKGFLTFGDIPELLNSCEKAKELLEYRLDSKFKHWLFDEFQDTSQTQWNFFASIIDRIINPQQDDDSGKTFYYVGDLKQSIYSWRGGNKELFKNIFQDYKDHEKNPIKELRSLEKSYRCHLNIIKAVNEIFTKDEKYSLYLKDTFKEEPTSEFLDIFKEHIVAKKDSEKTSITQLRVIKKLEDDTSKEEASYQHILDIIKEVKDSKKSIGILVNKNKEIQAISEFLKKNGVQVAPEGEKNLAQNNMLAAAFIQLLKHLGHAEDTASFEYLKMTPFATKIQEKGFKENALTYLSTGKYTDFLKDLCADISIKNHINFQYLCQACTEFEKSKKRGIDKLINFLENKRIKLSSNSNFVQIMTIHKSKGLEFSIVILPHLEGLTSLKTRALQVLENNEKSTISYLPSSQITALNKTLSKAKKSFEYDAMFENICKFYVALTRAENAMYLIINDTKKTQPAINTLLTEAFFRAKTQDVLESEICDIYNIGESKWYDNIEQKNTKAEEEKSINTIENPALVEDSLKYISPSRTKSYDINSSEDFVKFGTAIHKVLEQIVFIDSDTDSAIANAISPANTELRFENKIKQKLKDFFSKEEIMQFFRLSKKLKVTNEFDFNCLIDDTIVAGQIDRLMLEEDSEGKVISATVIDYKSSYNSEQDAQLLLYKKAIQQSFELEAERISTHVLAYSTNTVTTIHH